MTTKEKKAGKVPISNTQMDKKNDLLESSESSNRGDGDEVVLEQSRNWWKISNNPSLLLPSPAKAS